MLLMGRDQIAMAFQCQPKELELYSRNPGEVWTRQNQSHTSGSPVLHLSLRWTRRIDKSWGSQLGENIYQGEKSKGPNWMLAVGAEEGGESKPWQLRGSGGEG